MLNTTTWAIIGAILSSYHLCRFIFWLDDPRRR